MSFPNLFYNATWQLSHHVLCLI